MYWHKWKLWPALLGVLVLGASSYAYAQSGLEQVKPRHVPLGELALESRIPTPFHLKAGSNPDHDFSTGAEVTVEHYRFPAGTSSGWHSHAGPLFVEVVSGTLSLYEANDPTCTATRYSAGTGFLEPGFGNIHDARNEGRTAVDIYVTYVLPPGSGDAGLFIPAPSNSNSACPFSS